VSDVTGTMVDEGGVRLQDSENDDAWIEADYREGWHKRKIMGDGDYSEMVEPYYLKCRSCHRHRGPMLWGAGSPYCPDCEQRIEYMLPRAFAGIFGDGWDGESEPVKSGAV